MKEMFINRVPQNIISDTTSQEDREELGSLISDVEYQCFDEKHNRDSMHMSSTAS